MARARRRSARGRTSQRTRTGPADVSFPGGGLGARAGEGEGEAQAAGGRRRCAVPPRPRPRSCHRRPATRARWRPPAPATRARSPTARASRCGPMSRARSTAWRRPRADGVRLIVTSGYRSDAEQAELYERHPDPKWVAPPGKSLHRWGTELDLGPPSAYGWLARATPSAFHFVQRYTWEPWHYGYTLNPRSTPILVAVPGGPATAARRASFVPAAYREPIARAASRWNVSASLLAAQPYARAGSIPSRSARPARAASRSSCPVRRAPTACATRSTRRPRSRPRHG